MGRPFFPLFFKDRGKLQYLSMEQRGELLTALFAYAEDGEIPVLDGLSGFAFEVFKEGIDTSLKAYEDVCQKNRENGKKGGRPKKNPTVIEKTERFSEETQNNPAKPKETQKTEIEAEGEAEAEEEVEDEAEGEAEAEEEGVPSPAAAAISSYFHDLFGRNPDAEFLQTAEQTGFGVGVIKSALEECKTKGARRPEAYARTILRRWVADGVPSKYQQAAEGCEPPPDAPLSDWERDWLDEFRAAQKKMEDDYHAE